MVAKIKKSLNIALLDLNHMTRGIHTNTVPLGIGLIAEYIHKTSEITHNIRLYKDHGKLLSDLEEWIPDIVGLAQYCWNSELNYFFSRKIKELNPEVINVAGGPNLDHDTEKRVTYLHEYKVLDICVQYDGENPFAEIVNRVAYGENRVDLISNLVRGTFALDLVDNSKLSENFKAPEQKVLNIKSDSSILGHVEFRKIAGVERKPAPRIDTLDVFGAMYPEGRFDQFLDDGFHPFVQTHRGCPFLCTFCHTADKYYNKMRFQSTELFRKDMEYLGKRFANKDDVKLYIANTNMSMFKEDFDIAYIIKDIQEKYNWPKFIDVNSGKDTDKLLKMIDIINIRPAIAVQTLTDSVLDTIKRKNIGLEKFESFQKTVSKKTGVISSTELIMCLPGETIDSFIVTIKKVIDSSIKRIVIYTLMKLKGTPIDSIESVKKYKYDVRHRIVPGQFSMIDGELVTDTEQVIVATNTFSFDEYLDIRLLTLTITIFITAAEFLPFKMLIEEGKFSTSEWLFALHEKCIKDPRLDDLYESFISETKDELFESRELLFEFYSRKENYKKLLDGEAGANLINKYHAQSLMSNFDTLLDVVSDNTMEFIHEKKMVEDVREYVGSRNIVERMKQDYKKLDYESVLQYDVPTWFESANQKHLSEYCGNYKYKVYLNREVASVFKKYFGINKDVKMSRQIFFRDNTSHLYWDMWKAS